MQHEQNNTLFWEGVKGRLIQRHLTEEEQGWLAMHVFLLQVWGLRQLLGHLEHAGHLPSKPAHHQPISTTTLPYIYNAE